jgi:hypothetical protein
VVDDPGRFLSRYVHQVCVSAARPLGYRWTVTSGEEERPALLAATYLVPLATSDDTDVSELGTYLRGLAGAVDDVVVVDGSSPAAVHEHRRCFGPGVRVIVPELRTPMGKVGNVVTGVRAARHEAVVIGDDDVRYRTDQLGQVVARLHDGAVVRPQNHFDPRPWHARFDTARTLLARVTGGDWPGTLAVRRSAVLAAGGYAGDVMFENLELVRTLQAQGGREVLALDVIVRRLPPTTAHFRGQQVRQAYDEFARPARLVLSLLVAPVGVAAVVAGRWRPVLAAAAAVTAAAEAGRRRGGGRAVFPVSSTALAAPWCLWRSLCSWAALGARARGGVRYRDTRLRTAATPGRILRRRLADVEPGEEPLIGGWSGPTPTIAGAPRRSGARAPS